MSDLSITLKSWWKWKWIYAQNNLTWQSNTTLIIWSEIFHIDEYKKGMHLTFLFFLFSVGNYKWEIGDANKESQQNSKQ